MLLKKSHIISSVILLSMLLTACSIKSDNITNPHNISLHPLTTPSDFYIENSITTTLGYYEPLQYTNGFNIAFLDPNTKSEFFLCSNINCNHNNDICKSYFPNNITIFKSPTENSFFYITYETIDIAGKKYSIYEVNNDGENRKKLFEFDSKYVYRDDMIVFDGDSFYTIMGVIEDGYYNALIKASLSTGKCEELLKITENEVLLSAAKNNIYLVSSDYKTGNNIYKFDVTKNTYELIYKLAEPVEKNVTNIYGEIINRRIYIENLCIKNNFAYVINRTDGSLRSINLETLQETIIGYLNKDMTTFFKNITDDYIFMYQTESGKQAGYFLDLSCNSLNEITLLDNNNKILFPQAITKDYTVCIIGYKPVETTISGPDNIPYVVTSESPVKVIFKTDDFLSSINNYTIINTTNLNKSMT